MQHTNVRIYSADCRSAHGQDIRAYNASVRRTLETPPNAIQLAYLRRAQPRLQKTAIWRSTTPDQKTEYSSSDALLLFRHPDQVPVCWGFVLDRRPDARPSQCQTCAIFVAENNGTPEPMLKQSQRPQTLDMLSSHPSAAPGHQHVRWRKLKQRKQSFRCTESYFSNTHSTQWTAKYVKLSELRGL